MSAAWFWNSRHLNAVADAGDVVKATKLINGGNIGLQERTELYEEALEIFG
jgi:putative chitinase